MSFQPTPVPSATPASQEGNPLSPTDTPSASGPPTTAVKTEGNSPTLSKTTACLPIVYGSVAFFLGKEADEFQTHRWTLYIRSPNHEDLSVAISKVVFQLHASFSQPIRELTSPPFEVTECGWGEFEAQIRIVWKDPDEKPTVVRYLVSKTEFLVNVGYEGEIGMQQSDPSERMFSGFELQRFLFLFFLMYLPLL
jgi:transcription initiation factor IIF auxiliary subunit